jgi:hypothetical protein
MTNTETARLRDVCTHEAGHCIAYLALGMKFTAVRIYCDEYGEILGQVRAPAGRRDALKYATACLAGPLAEHRLTGVIDAEAWSGDTRMAADAIKRLSSGSSDEYGNTHHTNLNRVVLALAADLVSRNWQQIAMLATILAARKQMTYAEVVGAVERCRSQSRQHAG